MNEDLKYDLHDFTMNDYTPYKNKPVKHSRSKIKFSKALVSNTKKQRSFSFKNKNILFLNQKKDKVSKEMISNNFKQQSRAMKHKNQASPEDVRRMYEIDKIKRDIAPNMLLDSLTKARNSSSHSLEVNDSRIWKSSTKPMSYTKNIIAKKNPWVLSIKTKGDQSSREMSKKFEHYN